MGKIRPKQDNKDKDEVGFEEAMERLEAIVQELEEGDIGLTDAMTRYEEGVKLLRNCYGKLQRAERRIELLTGVDDEDAALGEPFDDEASLELAQQEKPRTSRRRTAKKVKKGPSRKPPEPPETMDDSPSLF